MSTQQLAFRKLERYNIYRTQNTVCLHCKLKYNQNVYIYNMNEEIQDAKKIIFNKLTI